MGRSGKASSSSGAAVGRSPTFPRQATAWAALLLTACGVILAGPSSARAAGPPQIFAAWVTDVSATGAVLRLEVNPNGFPTSYRFEYITDAAYQANLNAQPPRDGFFGAAKVPTEGQAPGQVGAGTSPVEASKSVGGLIPATTYHYRPAVTNSAGPPLAPAPEHTLTTQASTLTFKLPDGRRWELVSPLDKGGGAIGSPGVIFGGGDFQAAEGGAAVTYGSATAFDDPAGAPPVSQYVSSRTASGWSTENVSAPLDSGAYGDHPDGAPYRVFSADLARGLLFGGLACRGALPGCPAPNPVLPGTGAPDDYMAYYLREGASGAFSSLLTSVPPSGVDPEFLEISFAGACPDLSRVVLSSCAALTPGASEILTGPGKCDPAAQNLYEWSAAGLAVVNSTPGAALAAPIGAVSANGSRIYWAQGGDLHLHDGTQSAAVAGGEGATFETASADGRFAFFTKAGHLYRYDAVAEGSADLTPAGGVVGVLGASADGLDVYFQDASGIERWHEGVGITSVVAGPGAAAPSDYPPATATARVSASGDHLAFLSAEEITEYDNDGEIEVYLYGPPRGAGLRSSSVRRATRPANGRRAPRRSPARRSTARPAPTGRVR